MASLLSVFISLFCIHHAYCINYIGSYGQQISYNNKIGDITFQNSIELSFEIRLTAPCSAPTSYPFCHILKIGIPNQDYPRLPLLYTKSGDSQIRSVFTSTDGQYSPDYINNINVYDGYYHNIHIKYSPSQILITADNIALVNDTNGRMIPTQYHHTQYSIYMADNAATSSSGYIRYLDINTWTESPPDIIIRNHMDIQQWWVSFYAENIDLTTCGGIITNAEITDNVNYDGVWVPYNETKYNLWSHFSFGNQGYPFTPPITIRFTKSSPYEVLVLPEIITSFTGNEKYNSGDNFCRTDSPTTATYSPSMTPTLTPTNTPTITPSVSPTNNPSDFPSKNPTENPSQTPSSAPTLFPSVLPSQNPSRQPSMVPTHYPSVAGATYSPTSSPSKRPTNYPTQQPSIDIDEEIGESENVSQSTTEVVLQESEEDYISRFLMYIIIGGAFVWSVVIGIVIYCKCCQKKRNTNAIQTNTTMTIQNNTNTPGKDGPVDTSTVTIKINSNSSQVTPGGPNENLKRNLPQIRKQSSDDIYSHPKSMEMVPGFTTKNPQRMGEKSLNIVPIDLQQMSSINSEMLYENVPDKSPITNDTPTTTRFTNTRHVGSI